MERLCELLQGPEIPADENYYLIAEQWRETDFIISILLKR